MILSMDDWKVLDVRLLANALPGFCSVTVQPNLIGIAQKLHGLRLVNLNLRFYRWTGTRRHQLERQNFQNNFATSLCHKY